MIEPILAPVRPRGSPVDGGVAVLLEEEIRAVVERGDAGAIEILGGPGEGKTTALQHLRAALGEPKDVLFIDEPADADPIQEAAYDHTVIYTVRRSLGIKRRESYRLANWTLDDAIECLLAEHNSDCKSIVHRLREAPDLRLLAGNPALWRVVLQEMTCSGEVITVKEALLRRLETLLPTAEDMLAAEYFAFASLTFDADVLESLSKLNPILREPPMRLLLRLPPVQRLLAARHIVNRIREKKLEFVLGLHLVLELIEQTAQELATEPEVAQILLQSLSDKPRETDAMAASLIHATGYLWQPAAGSSPLLAGAFLGGIDWSGSTFEEPVFRNTGFQGAKLDHVKWREAACKGATFASANLHAAELPKLQGSYAIYSHADLSAVKAPQGHFANSDLEGANFAQAECRGADFTSCNLTSANFRQANLFGACFLRAKLASADFRGANLNTANLSGQTLRGVHFTGASFCEASLQKCDLECIYLPGAVFESALFYGSYLSGSRFRFGNFHKASLRSTGLADIDWEGADLREADLTGATFHMGSSRSGLVDSLIASEGTRTGFYTDEYNEQDFKTPEEIRKANLRGADLRGAHINGVDFYLVDLRDAQYSNSQFEWFRQCGAILANRL